MRPSTRTVVMLWASVVLASAAAAAAPSAIPEATYTAIQNAFLREQFEEVVRLVKPLVEHPAITPQTLRVWLWYALSLQRLQRTNDALREIDRLKAGLTDHGLQTTLPGSAESLWPEVLFWEGEISRKAFQMGRAELAYRRLITGYPNSTWRPHAQLGLGRVLFHRQAYDEARQQFQDVARTTTPPSIAQEALLLQGLCDIKRKHFTAALALFEHLLQESRDPGLRVQTTFYLGEALTGLSRFEEAALAYQQVIEDGADTVWEHVAYFGLGWCGFQLNRCRESLQAFNDYLATGRTPAELELGQDAAASNGELLFAQGRCLMELGRDAEALARFDALRTRYPQDPLVREAAINQAELLERQQRFPEAAAILEATMQHPLESAQRQEAALRLGSVLLAQGDAQRALGLFAEAKDAQDPDLRQAAFNGFGDAQWFLGHDSEAERWYDEAIRLAQTSRGGLYAAYQLGRLKLQANQVDEAIDQFQGVLLHADSGLAADARLELAVAHLSHGDSAVAQRELEVLRTQAAGSPQADRANYYLALLALNEGQIDTAISRCDEVIQRLPQSEEALEARLLRADLLASHGSPQDALSTLGQAFTTAQSLTPRHRGQFAKKLGDLSRRAVAYVQAIRWYEMAWDDLPAARGELDYRIASCYEEAGDLVLASHRYQAITQTPWQLRGQLAAAKLMEREEQWQEAVRIYEGIARQAIPEAKIAQERLAALRSHELVGKP